MSILHSCYGGRLHADVTPSSLAEKVEREIAPLIVILTTTKKRYELNALLRKAVISDS